MALNNSSGTFTYLGVYNGKLTQRVPEGTDGAVERTTKTNKQVWELTYDQLSGMLTGIEFRESDYGKEIHFIVSDGPEKYKLQMQYSSGVAKSLITRLPNCDLKKPIEIHTGWDRDKERSFSYIRQDGQTIKSAYTKENPNGLPPMEKKKVKGKEIYDDSEQLEFLDAMLIKDIMPQLVAQPAPAKQADPFASEPETGDLPF